jgi:hypothetical protein
MRGDVLFWDRLWGFLQVGNTFSVDHTHNNLTHVLVDIFTISTSSYCWLLPKISHASAVPLDGVTVKGKVKVKVKLSLCFNWAPHHEGVFGSGSIAPHILYLGTRCRWVVSFNPWAFYPQGNSPWYPLDRRLGGTQSWSGRGGEEKESQHLPALEPLTTQPVAQ